MDMESVHNDIRDVLQRQACATCDVHVSTPAVQGFEAVHDELLLERDHHVACEDDPQRLGLNDAPTKSAVLGVGDSVVAAVGDHVDFAIASSDGVLAVPDRAVG